MSQLSNPHDTFFKEVFSGPEVAHDFIAHYLPPEVVSRFDLSTLEISKDSFVDEALQTHYSDILYRVSLQDELSQGYIYVLFEHKSYPDHQVAFQLLRYMLRIWEQGQKQGERLRPIFPVVMYHGKAKWHLSPKFSELIDAPPELQPYIPDYQYWLCDLSQYSDEVITGTVKLQVALLLLKYILQPEFWGRLPEIIGLLDELTEKQTALAYLETIIRYASGAAGADTDQTLRQVIEKAFPSGGEIMETILERWEKQGFDKGMQQGIQQGMQQGIQQTMHQALLDSIELILEIKFGAEGLRLLPEIRKIEDVDVLHAIQAGLKTVDTPQALKRIYQDID